MYEHGIDIEATLAIDRSFVLKRDTQRLLNKIEVLTCFYFYWLKDLFIDLQFILHLVDFGEYALGFLVVF